MRSAEGANLIRANMRIALLEPIEIGFGIKEAVGMIDAKALDFVLSEKLQHETVRRLKHVRQFHSERDQFGYVEESPIIEFFRADTPKGQPIMLLLEQLK